MIQTLMRHSLSGELRVRLVRIRDERNAAIVQHPNPVDLSPFRKVSGDDFFNVICDVYPAHVKRSVLSHETAHAAHVIAIIAEFVATETVDVGVEEVMDARESMEVFALVAFGADASREI